MSATNAPSTGRNRLAGETSPYLLQHADNPVNWYPWGEEALARAQREDKPILLSIGYSACHWCHVMAHESFEDPAVAAYMNEHFVNVKVDREERPDIDQIYQLAHQMLARRSGGWPLTMFLAPDQAPFFGGTYFPKEPKYGMPGFVALMERVLVAWREKRGDIDAQNAHVVAALGAAALAGTGGDDASDAPLTDAPIAEAVRALVGNFDAEHGGFGTAPKFPHPGDLALLMRHAAKTGDGEARHVALHTLARMADGGINDHLGGGFCRYSVDREWMIPHFEKMLYDNGPLLALYADAFVVAGDPRFERVAIETAAWMMREMQAPEGGFYSSLDADSEGHEGRFYVWDRDAAESLLNPAERAIVAQYYGLAGHANFEGHHWHLHVIQPLEDAARRVGQSPADAARHLATARAKLFAEREQRVRPGRDEKILASWNALAIRGMARAARVFGRDDWCRSARRALDLVRGTLWQPAGPGGRARLLATCKDGRAHLNAYLDDHAFLLDAIVEMLQADFRPDDLAFARDIADTLLAQFEDREAGGFFFTSHDHERLIQRTKPGHDNATPSGNGIAALALGRLGHLLGEPRYLDAAARTVKAFRAGLDEHPAGFAALLEALAETVEPPRIVVLRGAPDAMRAWQRSLARTHRPDCLVFAVDAALSDIPDVLAKPLPAAGVNAHVCRGVTCSLPVTSPDALAGLLDAADVG
jgi:uncharacterized protein YyaL (SSP411 family)